MHEDVEFASQMGATVVDLETTLSNDHGPLFELTPDARRAGSPGMLYQEAPTRQFRTEHDVGSGEYGLRD